MNHLRSPRLVLVPLVGVALVVIAGCHGGGNGDLAPSAAPSCSVDASQAGLRGDLNGNAQPDVSDAIAILHWAIETGGLA